MALRILSGLNRVKFRSVSGGTAFRWASVAELVFSPADRDRVNS
jgi:hypothetical protein